MRYFRPFESEPKCPISTRPAKKITFACYARLCFRLSERDNTVETRAQKH